MLASEAEEVQDGEMTQKANKGRKRTSLADKATFARRWQPTCEPGKTFWDVLRNVFETDVAPYLVRSSTLEARYGFCSRSFSRRPQLETPKLKHQTLNLEPKTKNLNFQP